MKENDARRLGSDSHTLLRDHYSWFSDEGEWRAKAIPAGQVLRPSYCLGEKTKSRWHRAPGRSRPVEHNSEGPGTCPSQARAKKPVSLVGWDTHCRLHGVSVLTLSFPGLRGSGGCTWVVAWLSYPAAPQAWAHGGRQSQLKHLPGSACRTESHLTAVRLWRALQSPRLGAECGDT